MDFMKLLRSFEEFLFEAVSWLVFYPLTVARIVVQPLQVMAYSDEQQTRSEDDQYDEAISPPLVLLLTVAAVSLMDAILHVSVPQASHLMQGVMASPQNSAIFRGIMFSLIPLVAALTLLRHQRTPLSRSSLKAPFYAQCFLATPCALVVGIGTVLIYRPDTPNEAAAGISLAGAAWFLITQTRWFAQHLSIGYLRAAWIAAWALVRACVYLVLLLLPVALA